MGELSALSIAPQVLDALKREIQMLGVLYSDAR